MYVAALTFRRLKGRSTPEDAIGGIEGLVGALMTNGQVLGKEFATARTSRGYSATVILPEEDSLLPRHNNRHVRDDLRALRSRGVAVPLVRVVGPKLTGSPADRCKRPSWRILFTSRVMLNSTS